MGLAVVLGLTLFGSAGLADATVAAPAYRMAASSAGASAEQVAKPQAASSPNSFSVTAIVLPYTPVPACSPDHFSAPAAMELATAQADRVNVDSLPVHHYRVYGDTAAGIEQQIAKCAPGGDFAGQTAYYLNWSFYPKQIGGGQCRLTGIKVGLRLQTSLPSWQANASADPGLATKWQRFASDLAVHEQGHASLDKLYAIRLLHALQSLPAGSCSQVVTIATAVANQQLAALQAANQGYDAQTQHGATQGAILPR